MKRSEDKTTPPVPAYPELSELDREHARLYLEDAASQEGWERLPELRERLLALGGSECYFPPNKLMVPPDVALDHGLPFPLEHMVVWDGVTYTPERELIMIHHANEGSVELAMGYALTPRGIWKPHLWAVDTRSELIIDAEFAHEVYYGLVLTEEQAIDMFLAYAPELLEPVEAAIDSSADSIRARDDAPLPRSKKGGKASRSAASREHKGSRSRENPR